MKERLEPLQPNENFRVEYTLKPKKTNMPSFHYHDCYEIYYFLGDKAIYFIENRSIEVRTHDIIFVDKFTYHKTWYQDHESIERFLIYINDEFLKSIKDKYVLDKVLEMFQKKKLKFPNTLNKFILQELRDKIYPACNQKSNPVSKTKAEFTLLTLLLSMAEAMEKGIAIEPSISFNIKEKRIADIINYININYTANITLDTLSKEFFISKYYLCHIFKEIVGISITDYILEKRLIEAKKLLCDSDYNITQISQLVGFNTVSYFITLFKKKYGCSPSAFRKKIGKD